MDNAQDAGQDERMTVADAAATLGISKEAVRKRITRDTLRSDKDPDGTVYVYVPPSPTPSGTASATGAGDRDLLYQEQRERIAYLERQVEEEREARRRADTLLARLMDRVPELEAPTDSAPETSETTARTSEDAPPRSSTGVTEVVATEALSEAEPSLLWEWVVVVILSTLPLTSLLLLASTTTLSTSVTGYFAAGTVVLAWIVFPAVFGFRLGRKVRRLRFWGNVAPVAALLWLVSAITEVLLIGSFFLAVIPSIVYIFATVFGNALRRRTREKLIEERPSEFPQEAAASAQGWTPRQQAIVGLAGTIISALIGLIGTILTVMASGSGG